MSASTHSRIEFEEARDRRAGVERSEPGGRAELGAGGAPAAGAPRSSALGEPGRRHELRPEVAEEALALARMRRGLAAGGGAGGGGGPLRAPRAAASPPGRFATP